MYYHQGGLFNRNHKNLEAGQSALHTCHLECIGIHLSTFLLLFPPCNSTDKVYLAANLKVVCFAKSKRKGTKLTPEQTRSGSNSKMEFFTSSSSISCGHVDPRGFHILTANLSTCGKQ